MDWIVEDFEPSVRLPGGAGRYARSPGQTALELYGTADMACVLHMLRRLRPTEFERAEWASAFQELQNPDTGWLLERDATHTPLHNTAFALAAMELLDLRPRHPARIEAEFDNLRAFLETIDWRQGVSVAIRAQGLARFTHSCPNLAGLVLRITSRIVIAYSTRTMGDGSRQTSRGDYDQIGGTFHYHFIYSHFQSTCAFR